jgi:hypothetical protein
VRGEGRSFCTKGGAKLKSWVVVQAAAAAEKNSHHHHHGYGFSITPQCSSTTPIKTCTPFLLFLLLLLLLLLLQVLNSHLPTCQFFCLRFWEDVKHRFRVYAVGVIEEEYQEEEEEEEEEEKVLCFGSI